jgi:hypothetical protein
LPPHALCIFCSSTQTRGLETTGLLWDLKP